MREQVERLEHDPDPSPDPVEPDAVGGDVLALDHDPARVDGLEPVDAPQQRGLARARGADQAHDLVLGDDQVDPAQHLERPERLVQALDPQGLGRGRTGGSRRSGVAGGLSGVAGGWRRIGHQIAPRPGGAAAARGRGPARSRPASQSTMWMSGTVTTMNTSATAT